MNNYYIVKHRILNVYEILDKIRMRPGLYLGHLSPTHLNSFLSGYFLDKDDKSFKKEIPDFYGFHNWVANKFDYYESTSGWAYMIEDQREDKLEALFLFYELLDEYRGIKHKQIAKIKFNHENKLDTSFTGYSRLKKVRGTFKEVPKPLPQELMIRKIKLDQIWFQLVAKNSGNEILFIASNAELENIYKSAKKIFGIEKEEWKF